MASILENRYKIIYDIKQRNIVSVKFKQGDVDSSVLEVTLMDNSVAIDLTGQAIEFRFLKPDKTIVFQDSTSGVNIVTPLSGKVECVLTNQTLASSGVVNVEIYRSLSGKGLTTPRFYFTIETSIGEDGILSTNYISSIENKLIEWQADIDVLKGTSVKGDTGIQGPIGPQGIMGLTGNAANPIKAYATLAALTAAVPVGDATTYVVAADGNWYYWGGSAWIVGGLYQGLTLAPGSVDVISLIPELVQINIHPNVDTTIGYSSSFGGNADHFIVHGIPINTVGVVNFTVKTSATADMTMFLLTKAVDGTFTLKDKKLIHVVTGTTSFSNVFPASPTVGDGTEFVGWYKTSTTVMMYNAGADEFGYYMSSTVSPSMVLGTSFPSSQYLSASFGIVFFKTVIKVIPADKDVITRRWQGKIINCLGDSLTQGDVTGAGVIGTPWTANIKNITKSALCRNYGLSGTYFAGNSSNSMITRFPAMDSNADLVCIWGGTNDFVTNFPLGVFGDTAIETFYGSLDFMIKGLYTKYPNGQFMFITPPKMNKVSFGWETYTPNALGLVEQDYVTAIKTVCDKYSCPVLDIFTIGGMSCYLDTGLYRPDGLHYTNLGYKRLSYIIAEFMETL